MWYSVFKQVCDPIDSLFKGAVTDEELRTFSEAVLTKDNTNGSLQVNVKTQGKTRAYSSVDEAPLPLVACV